MKKITTLSLCVFLLFGKLFALDIPTKDSTLSPPNYGNLTVRNYTKIGQFDSLGNTVEVKLQEECSPEGNSYQILFYCWTDDYKFETGSICLEEGKAFLTEYSKIRDILQSAITKKQEIRISNYKISESFSINTSTKFGICHLTIYCGYSPIILSFPNIVYVNKKYIPDKRSGIYFLDLLAENIKKAARMIEIDDKKFSQGIE